MKAPHPVSSGKYKSKQQQDVTTHLSEWPKPEDLTTADAGEGVEQHGSRRCWWDCRMVHSAFKCFKKFSEVRLSYSVVLISAVKQRDSVIRIYTFFLISVSIMGYPKTLSRVPVLHSRALFIHPLYNGSHVLTLNFRSFPPPLASCSHKPPALASCSHKPVTLSSRPFPPALASWQPVLRVCESVCVSQISSFASYFRFHIEAVSYGICPSLTSLSRIASRSVRVAAHRVIALFFTAG